jgi:hypothetical protein
MSDPLKKTVIVCSSSWPKEKILFWHDYHKQFCPNVKMMQVIPPMSTAEIIQHEDVTPLHMDTRIIYLSGDLLWANWLESPYDNFVFMEHDAFMLKPVLAELFDYMRKQSPRLECLFGPLQSKQEHRKLHHYSAIVKFYHFLPEDVRWCHSNSTLITRKGLETYHKENYCFAGSELTVPAIFRSKKSGCENRYINVLTNRASPLGWDDLVFARGDKASGFVHAVKDYNSISKLTGFNSGYDKGILGIV